MAALSHWASADSAGFRRQSRSGSFLGPPRLFTGAYYPAIQQTVVVDGALPGTTESKDEVKVRKRETIFGPDVGDDDQPGWTEGGDGKAVSVDVVKRWVDKAKGEEGLHTTTTLQALVNLKRPSLLLHPLDHVPEADVTSAPVPPAQPLHLLKFNYDAMTPLVNITLSLYPNNKSDEVVSHQPPKVLYTGVHPGGFNKLFDLPKEAALDLNLAIVPIAPVEEAIEEEDESRAAAPPASVTTSRTSGERAEPTADPDPTAIPEHHQEQQHTGRRFGLFRRQREHDVEANIEMTPTNEPPAEETKKEDKKEEEEEHGMRLVISLEAIGPEGEPLRRRNAQLTHILVSGTWVPDAGATDHSGTGKRVWVVKVVRREAQIGGHSFLLKEIYGLSSAAGADSTYPPTSSDPYASTPNECIVCLTSPRDVVLLPCRHLVVCRECAVGMVEFGAGGRVARRDDEAAAAAATAGGATTGTTEEPPQMGVGIGGLLTPAPAPPPAPRRKKKAKGWYCPVCRQPYTSLLRLALPSSKESGAATPGVIEPVQRAGSIRSMRTTRSTRSVATLPRGAEEMLSGLGPEISDDEDDEDDDRERIEARERAEELERPQFVIGEATTSPPPRTATPSQQADVQTPPASPPARATAAGPPVTSIPAAPGPSATADPSAAPAAAVAALRVE